MAAYEYLSSMTPVQDNTWTLASCILAMRHLLGFGVEADTSKTFEYIGRVPLDKGERIVPAVTRGIVEKLRDVTTRSRFSPNRDERSYGAAKRLLQSLYTGQKKFGVAGDEIEAGTTEATRALSDCLWVAYTLAQLEEDPIAEQWKELRKATQAKLLGVTSAALETTSRQFGPRYNPLDAKGFLVPGAIETGPVNSEGINVFKGLHASKDGSIELYFTRDSQKPPLIFPEDVDVLLTIAFHPQCGVAPRLSIENIDGIEGPDGPRWLPHQKIWWPMWVGHTELGKTLYAADYWVGKLAWHSDQSPVSERDIPDPAKRARAIALLREFELCGGQQDGISSRVMIKQGDVRGTWRQTKARDWICDVHHVEMKVDGSDVDLVFDASNSLVEDLERNLNDPRFAMGRVANQLTRHYDEIAEFFPMFERGRQLMGIMQTLFEVNERGFKPSRALKAAIDRTYRHYTQKPELTLQQRLCI